VLEFRTLVIATAVIAGVAACVAFAGKLSRRLGDRAVDRLYYVSYVFMTLGILLMAMQGLFARRG